MDRLGGIYFLHAVERISGNGYEYGYEYRFKSIQTPR
jgi:hypothetical protein